MAEGTWGIGNFKLPDIGFTEALGIFKPNPIFAQSNYTTETAGAGPMPTPNPPSGVDYTPQQSGSYVSPTGYPPSPVTNTSSPGGANPQNNYVAPSGDSPSGGSPAPSGGGIPSVDMSFYQGWNDQNAINADWAATWQQKTGQGGGGGGPVADPYAGVRDDISSGYDAYFANLDEQLAGLPGQQTSQNQIAENSYNTGVGDLNLQSQQGTDLFTGQRAELATNQSKNLKSLDENLRNLFMAGNVYLGSRGAGDSSAANQYSYALTKQGNQARGDQMNQFTKAYSDIQGRETNLKNIVDNEMTKLKTNYDTQKLQIGQWFQDSQQRVKDAIAQGQLSKGTDLANLSKSILDQSIQAMNQLKQNSMNQQNSLVTWAQNNSKNIGELKSNLQQAMSIQIPNVSPANMSGQITTDAQGNAVMNPMTGYGSTSERTKNGIFD